MTTAAESLLQRIARGDDSAIGEAMNAYGGLVWSMARWFCRNDAEAEDAVQEIFLSLWQHADRFDGSIASEKTFVSMIARRRLVDLLRKKTRRRERITDDVPAEAIEPFAQGNNPEVMDESRRITEVMEQLRPEQKQVLMLSVVRGLTHEQIASVTEMPLGTVKTHARRGLIRIRQLLQEQEHGSSSSSGGGQA